MPPIFPERIETDRLRLERLNRETVDVFELYRICSADDGIERVTEYLPWTPHDTVKETIEFLEDCEEDRADDKGAAYVVRPRDGEEGAGEIAGLTGLGVNWDRRTANLGLWLRTRFWGRGYAQERAAALIEVAFEHLDLELIAVEHQAGNENSRRAIEKYVDAHGGRHEGRLRNWATNGGEPVDQHRYTISRSEYEEAVGE